MIRSSGYVTNIARRGFSSSAHHQFLRRIRWWPFERRPEPVQYRLQVQRPRFHGVKKFGRGILRFVIITSVVYYFLPVTIELGTDDDELEQTGEKTAGNVGSSEASAESTGPDESEDEEESDGFFLPLSWPVQAEQTFYKGSDPEWQNYMKFARDKESQRRAHQAVVLLCRHAFIEIPELASSIGQIDMDKGKYWLDVDFPLGPPPEYDQVGLEINTNFVALAVATISQEDYNQLCRYFDPAAAVTASKEALRLALRTFDYVFWKAKERLQGTQGLDNSSDSSEGASRPAIPTSLGASDASQAGDGHGGLGLPASQGIANSAQPSGPQSSNSDDMAGPDQSQAKYQLLRAYFSKPFTQNMEVAPPRGSVVLGGLVECHGTNYVATVDVVAAWDLVEEQIVMHNAKLRHITPRKIAPHPSSRGSPFGNRRPPHGPLGSGGSLGPGGPPMV